MSAGILVDSSTIIRCRANNNGGNGIRATYSTIAECITKFNGEHGIYAARTSQISENCLTENGEYGLYLDPNNNYAIKNGAADNTGGAFYSQGPNNYLPTSGDDANYEF